MFQPDFFTPLYPAHWRIVRPGEQTQEGNMLLTEQELGGYEQSAQLIRESADFTVWFDGAVWQIQCIYKKD